MNGVQVERNPKNKIKPKFIGVVIFAWKYGYSEIKSKNLDAKAAESRENVEKWRLLLLLLSIYLK